MTLTCPHKVRRDSICASCVVQMIESAVMVERAKTENLREVLTLALTGINSDVYPSCWRVVQQAVNEKP